MDEIQFIVAKLQQPPFEEKLTLVDFDEKNPHELLQLLVDVFAKLDEQMGCNVREVPRDQLIPRIAQFLALLKMKMPQGEDEREAFLNGIVNGDKVSIYPVLHWALDGFPRLKKRAYLAKFLVRVEIPPEFMQDEVLQENHATLQNLQQQFKEVHMEVEKLRAEPTRPQEIKNEITTLEDEKKQLRVRIERLKKEVEGDASFVPLLEATSKLRQEQDEDNRLNETMRKQRMALQHAQHRRDEAQRKLQQLQQSQQGNPSAESMLTQLQQEVRDLQHRATSVLPREIEEQQQRLNQLMELRFEPQRTPEDIADAQREVRMLDQQCQELRQHIDDMVAARGDNKLSMYRQTALLASKKVAAKEDECEAVQEQKRKITAEIDALEAKLSEMSGPKFMTRKEFHSYGVQLREKTHVYKAKREELTNLRAESVVLHRTEQLLRGRDKNLDDFLQQLEAKRGVTGYRATQEKLEKASEQTASVDKTKGSTLEEVSEIVRKINEELIEQKTFLSPQIKLLRDVRKVYHEVDAEYNRKRQLYDKVAVGLEVERQQLEQECDAAQTECLREESRYHYLNSLYSLAESTRNRVQNEEKWEKGDGYLLPQFKTYSQLYKDKISRQQVLTEQIRKRKSAISGNESGNMDQRRQFADLHNLLNCKLKSKKRLEEEKLGFGSAEYDMGGAKVMKLSSD